MIRDFIWVLGLILMIAGMFVMPVVGGLIVGGLIIGLPIIPFMGYAVLAFVVGMVMVAVTE